MVLFFAKLVSYTFLYWLPNYIKMSGKVDPRKAADLSTLFDLGGIFGGVVAGAISDMTGASASVCCLMLFLAMPMVRRLCLFYFSDLSYIMAPKYFLLYFDYKVDVFYCFTLLSSKRKREGKW